MSNGFWPALLIVVLVIAWVVAKVLEAVKKSERQWQQVDKSKLRKWDDEDGD